MRTSTKIATRRLSHTTKKRLRKNGSFVGVFNSYSPYDNIRSIVRKTTIFISVFSLVVDKKSFDEF